MTRGILFESRVMRGLTSTLDGLVRRQAAISDNVANADTPGYRAKDVEFQTQLDALLGVPRAAQLTRTDAAHFRDRDSLRLSTVDGVSFRTVTASDRAQLTLVDASSSSNDGGGVSIEREMVKLAETQLAFATTARLLSGRLEALRALAREGR